ncbi:MBL fold metallo-hydrolase [Danxiaibacter flavus]|uniref:MBL fold metallo-hydrolase n=1 Tax=Danxiaibacter flavus TaxID=3049108 RepID=A0ABV3Z947_9BACT|nr:MBL fold metallo-hydrolase [Chitinophagaceae bacterium DXS]
MISISFFTFSPIQENTYLLHNEKGEALIIDPGCYFSAENETLKEHILKAGLTPVQLLNTHCHLDHVFGNKWVAKTYGLELYIHPDEEKMLELAPQSGLMYGLGFDNYKGSLHFLNEGDVVKLGDDELKVILAPGHSPGSICFYNEKQHFLIGGDVLFQESIGRTDLPFGNHEQLLKNIKEKLYILPDETVVYPGHGPSTTIGHEKKHNPFVRA